MTPRILIRGLVFIATLVAVGFLYKESGLEGLLDKAWIDAQVRGQGVLGQVLFVAAGAAFVAVGLPRQLVSFLGGYAFGLVGGTALALLASVIGCATAFSYSRLLGRAVVAARLSGRVQRIDAFLAGNPLTMTLLIRLLPVGSNLLTNLGAGVTGVGAVPFIAGSAIGYIPQTLVFALVGSGINVDPVLRIGLGVVLFVVSGMLGVTLFRRYRRGAPLDGDIAGGLADPLAETASAGAGRDSSG